LTAVYSRRCLGPAERCLAEGRLKVIAFHDQVRVACVTEDMLRAAGHDPEQLINLNTPEQHRRALQRLGPEPA
jgi:molybdopterin-guanine dinucleotide biosynthesis protein A